MAGQGKSVPAGTAGNRAGWTVTFAGTGVNLALGILYTWSVISANIPQEWGWSEAEKSLPYSIACLAFAFMTIPAGRMQDTIGPRWVAALGGVLVGIGLVLASLTTTSSGYLLGFGILAGAGIGCGYAAATPPAIKWFGKAKTGLISGIVVSGFGLASVYAAPVTQWLSGSFGLQTAMLVLGIAFFLVVGVLSQFLNPPPAGYVPPEDAVAATAKSTTKATPAVATVEAGPREMLGTSSFYLMWFMYFCAAGAGLMIISKMSKIATDQAGVALGFVLVAILAIGNGGGRVLAGMLSDKMGRTRTLLAVFLLQAVMMILISQAVPGSPTAHPVVLALIAMVIGGCYGANLAVFPSITKDWFGLKNFGFNYGFVFTAWGVGGFVMSLVAGALYDSTQTFTQAFYLAAVLLVIVAMLTFVIRPPRLAAAHRKARTT